MKVSWESRKEGNGNGEVGCRLIDGEGRRAASGGQAADVAQLTQGWPRDGRRKGTTDRLEATAAGHELAERSVTRDGESDSLWPEQPSYRAGR